MTSSDVALPSDLDPSPLGRAVTSFGDGDIQAIVSRIPLPDLLDQQAQDPVWLIPRVRAHDRVLTAVAGAGPVVPFRFGVVYRDEESLTRRLASSAGSFSETLRRLGGSQEWTIQASPAPSGARRSASPSNGAPGRSYLASRHAELTVGDRVDAALAELHRACHEWGLPTALLPPDGDGAPRIACLIAHGEAQAVFSRLESAAMEEGILLATTGPLPPYHFVDDGLR